MFDTISLEGLLLSLSSLAPNNKRWLAEHLLEQVKNDTTQSNIETEDEKFMSDFFSLPYENPMSASEKKELIRSSRQSGVTRHINLKYIDEKA